MVWNEPPKKCNNLIQAVHARFLKHRFLYILRCLSQGYISEVMEQKELDNKFNCKTLFVFIGFSRVFSFLLDFSLI